LLNGAAALVLLAAVAYAPQSTFETKLAAAMMVFGAGAVAGLLSSFFAFVARTLSLEARTRASLINALRILAILAALGGGTSFLVGLNMVWDVSESKSSSHAKGSLEKKPENRTPPSQPQSSPAEDPPRLLPI
jgi:hypothetical protein